MNKHAFYQFYRTISVKARFSRRRNPLAGNAGQADVTLVYSILQQPLCNIRGQPLAYATEAMIGMVDE